MKQVALTRKTWHFRLWKYCYDTHPPYNLCPYFWGLLAAFPFSILVFIINNWPENKWHPNIPKIPEPGKRAGHTLLAVTAFTFFTTGALFGWHWHFYLLSLIGACLGVVGSIIYLKERYDNMKPKNTDIAKGLYKKPKGASMTKTYVKSWYDRNCPVVTWN